MVFLKNLNERIELKLWMYILLWFSFGCTLVFWYALYSGALVASLSLPAHHPVATIEAASK